MKLKRFFEYLTLGELKQLGIGGYEDYKEIQEEDYPEVVAHINLGLTKLYTRFPLLEKELVLETRLDKYVYLLSSKYAEASGNEDWYIQGEYNNDLIRVNSVYLGDTELSINDEFSPSTGVYLPSYNSIQIPFATGAEELTIIYRAQPEEVPLDLDFDIPIPDVLVEALLVYVEYRIRKGMGGEQGVALGQQALQMFEMFCNDVEKKNILNNADNSVCIRNKLGGWV